MNLSQCVLLLMLVTFNSLGKEPTELVTPDNKTPVNQKDKSGNYAEQHKEKLKSLRCKKVEERCKAECSQSCLPSCNHGFRFWNCVNRCKARHGC